MVCAEPDELHDLPHADAQSRVDERSDSVVVGADVQRELFAVAHGCDVYHWLGFSLTGSTAVRFPSHVGLPRSSGNIGPPPTQS